MLSLQPMCSQLTPIQWLTAAAGHRLKAHFVCYQPYLSRCLSVAEWGNSSEHKRKAEKSFKM